MVSMASRLHSLVLCLCLFAFVPGEALRGNVVVTFATNDVYALSAVVLARSMNAFGDESAAHVALVFASVSRPVREMLTAVGWDVRDVDPIQPLKSASQTEIEVDRDLTTEYSLLHAWDLDEFERALIIDADGIVKGSIDSLFDERYFRGNVTGRYERGNIDAERPFMNGALLAIRPSRNIPALLLEAGADGHTGMNLQGLLNMYFWDEWCSKGDEERVSNSMHFGAAACILDSSTEVIEEVRVATILDFQGRTKPWRWPEVVSYPSCAVLTAYAKLWVILLILPLSSKAVTARSFVEQTDLNANLADSLLTLAFHLAHEAMQESAVERARYALIAEFVHSFGVHERLRSDLQQFSSEIGRGDL
uniref:Hexosyltransferase n=1 Tax=Noctiluca scintillans TaxID=2966 RepID=A0A7S1AYR9_NOCSC|mmetsp:Transcript_65832/g.174563  ORF Transcript_65832/g.174563 Transcript_65832/m.174563 type:complete len:364 (+) Transcript_65832:39-1130(+)